MKKIMKMMLIMMMFTLVACGNNDTYTEATSKETITIQIYNEKKELVNLEIKKDPQRIAILDMSALDIIDALGLGDRVVGSAEVSIDYLKRYNPKENQAIMNLGSIKTADFEQVAACNPDVIFIGGRLSKEYQKLSEIAPVVFLSVDYEKGIVESTKENVQTIASIFNKEAEVNRLVHQYTSRIETLNQELKDKKVLLTMYNNNSLSIMDDNSQLNMIVNELEAMNLGEQVGESEKSTHGEDASWETIMKINPEYMFVLDRSSAIQASDKGLLGAKEVVENNLIKQLDVYKENKIIYFMDHANVWYSATGGIQALDIMLSDLEQAFLKS